MCRSAQGFTSRRNPCPQRGPSGRCVPQRAGIHLPSKPVVPAGTVVFVGSAAARRDSPPVETRTDPSGNVNRRVPQRAGIHLPSKRGAISLSPGAPVECRSAQGFTSRRNSMRWISSLNSPWRAGIHLPSKHLRMVVPPVDARARTRRVRIPRCRIGAAERGVLSQRARRQWRIVGIRRSGHTRRVLR